MQRKEATLLYRLHMIVFTRTVAGEVAGTRTVEWLRGTAATAGVVLSQKEGNVGRVVQKVGRTLFVPHMVGDRICACLGRRRKVESTEVLKRIARDRVPAEI